MAPSDSVIAGQYRRIVDATATVLSRKGYDRATVRQIIAVAGVSRRTFYDLFSGIEDVFYVAHTKALDTLGERVNVACGEEREWLRGVAVAIAMAIDWAATDPPNAQLVAAHPFVAGPFAGRCHDLLVARFAPGLAEGRLVAGIQLSLSQEEALLAGAAAVIARHVSLGLTSSGVLAAELTQLVLTPYVGSVEARRISRAGDEGGRRG